MNHISYYRGYEILEQAGAYHVYRDGKSAYHLRFNSAWSCICHIDEVLSP